MDEGVSQTSLEPSSCDLDPIALHLPFVPDSDFARVTQTGQVSDSVVLMTALPKTGMQTRVRPPAWRGQHDVEARGSCASGAQAFVCAFWRASQGLSCDLLCLLLNL